MMMYGAETWTLRPEHVKRLHNRCMLTILEFTMFQQWEQRLTSKSLASKLAIGRSIANIILDSTLQWLGHLGRMEDDRLPKKGN